jgi:hypothetical protein
MLQSSSNYVFLAEFARRANARLAPVRHRTDRRLGAPGLAGRQLPTGVSSRNRPEGEPTRDSWVTPSRRSAGDHRLNAGAVPVQLDGEALAGLHWRPPWPRAAPARRQGGHLGRGWCETAKWVRVRRTTAQSQSRP